MLPPWLHENRGVKSEYHSALVSPYIDKANWRICRLLSILNILRFIFVYKILQKFCFQAGFLKIRILKYH